MEWFHLSLVQWDVPFLAASFLGVAIHIYIITYIYIHIYTLSRNVTVILCFTFQLLDMMWLPL